MNLATQHLSDEAVAACADGVLGATANARAQRHIAVCAECAQAVAAQRDVAQTLRTAPLPALPNGLLDRLRAVPNTTALPQLDVALGSDGSPFFAAFRTHSPGRSADPREPMLAAASFVAAPERHRTRRHLGFGGFTGFGTFTAALVVAVGTAAVGAAIDYRDQSGPTAPAAPANVAPALIATNTGPGALATFTGLRVH